jgi:hypothetical protein
MQVLDSYGHCHFAALMGIPAKPLICKALARVAGIYQQSYPQNPWMRSKVLTDQALKAYFTSSHQDAGPTGAIR